MQIEKIVQNEISAFLQSKRINQDGHIFSVFNSLNRGRDIKCLQNALFQTYKNIVAFFGKEHEREIAKQMLLTLERIQAIRIDDTDEKTEPIKSAIECMKRTNHGELDSKGGLVRATKGEGVVIIVPALKAEIENNQNNPSARIIAGLHILTHEFIHVMSIWTNYDKNFMDVLYSKIHRSALEYSFGIQRHDMKDGIFYDINEGITELIARRILEKAYHGTPLIQTIDDKRYLNRVSVANKLFSLFDKTHQNQIMLKYLTGDGREVLNILKLINNGEISFFEHLKTRGKKILLRIFDLKLDNECAANDLAVVKDIFDFLNESNINIQEDIRSN